MAQSTLSRDMETMRDYIDLERNLRRIIRDEFKSVHCNDRSIKSTHRYEFRLQTRWVDVFRPMYGW